MSRSNSPRAGARGRWWRSPRRAAGRGRRVVPETCSTAVDDGEQARAGAAHAEAVLATPEGRRRATQLLTVNYEHIPVDLLVHQTLGVARCTAAPALIDHAGRSGWSLDAEKITCPVRIVWGTEDRLLPWPSAAARYREEWLPHADWVELEGVGHCPQFDVPLEDRTADPRLHQLRTRTDRNSS